MTKRKAPAVHVEVQAPRTQGERDVLSPRTFKRSRIVGKALQRRRARFRAHDPLCNVCRANNIVRLWTQLDHVVPLHKGGADDETNLQGLCDECHYFKTCADKGIQARPTIAVDGWPVSRGAEQKDDNEQS
jgi:5-methylcytosine-specific restriction protein A